MIAQMKEMTLKIRKAVVSELRWKIRQKIEKVKLKQDQQPYRGTLVSSYLKLTKAMLL